MSGTIGGTNRNTKRCLNFPDVASLTKRCRNRIDCLVTHRMNVSSTSVSRLASITRIHHSVTSSNVCTLSMCMYTPICEYALNHDSCVDQQQAAMTTPLLIHDIYVQSNLSSCRHLRRSNRVEMSGTYYGGLHAQTKTPCQGSLGEKVLRQIYAHRQLGFPTRSSRTTIKRGDG